MRSIIASLYLINVVVFFGGCHSKVANLFKFRKLIKYNVTT